MWILFIINNIFSGIIVYQYCITITKYINEYTDSLMPLKFLSPIEILKKGSTLIQTFSKILNICIKIVIIINGFIGILLYSIINLFLYFLFHKKSIITTDNNTINKLVIFIPESHIWNSDFELSDTIFNLDYNKDNLEYEFFNRTGYKIELKTVLIPADESASDEDIDNYLFNYFKDNNEDNIEAIIIVNKNMVDNYKSTFKSLVSSIDNVKNIDSIINFLTQYIY